MHQAISGREGDDWHRTVVLKGSDQQLKVGKEKNSAPRNRRGNEYTHKAGSRVKCSELADFVSDINFEWGKESYYNFLRGARADFETFGFGMAIDY